MLSYRDCLDMAAVTEDESAAIARHEHIPAIVALELGHNLLASEAGRKRLQEMIVSTVIAAQATAAARPAKGSAGPWGTS